MPDEVNWGQFAEVWNASRTVHEVARSLGIKWITARRRAYDYRRRRAWKQMAGESVEHLPELKKFSAGRPRASFFR